MAKIDFPTEKFNYERFREFAKDGDLSEYERIGFPDSYRAGYENAIVDDIEKKLEFSHYKGGVMLDVGSGASPVTSCLLQRAKSYGISVVMNDSPEMLSLISSDVPFTKLPGQFPKVLGKAMELQPDGYDLLLCYSVLLCVVLDGNVFDFVDAVSLALKPGGMALIGDIPNISKRRRFFASQEGIEFHKKFMNTDQGPEVDHFAIVRDSLDDAVLNALVARAHAAGNDAYILPQPRTLPMFNRRDDIVIQRRI
ncbi:class I SAM-dependent methyltransferase [Thalassospira sp. MA62]|nr:class I SAM-dependent methyltransferase [Thalassospira sp. MA62]